MLLKKGFLSRAAQILILCLLFTAAECFAAEYYTIDRAESLTVTLDRALDEDDFVNNVFAVNKSTNQPSGGSYEVAEDGKSLTFTPSFPLEYHTEYSLIVSMSAKNAEDKYTLRERTFTFVTKPDPTQPAPVSPPLGSMPTPRPSEPEKSNTPRPNETDSGSRPVLTPPPSVGDISVPSSLNPFTDTEGHWAESYINILARDNILRGFDMGGEVYQFMPFGLVTRQEMCVMLANALKIPPNEKIALPFNDVKLIGGWSLPYIQTMYERGLITGREYPDGRVNFDPQEPIKRIEMASLITKALGVVPTREPRFTDNSELPLWGTGGASALQELGIISGYEDGEFRPNNLTTRAEAAKIIYNAREVLKTINN